MEKKIIIAAKKAKDEGYIYMSSIVKSVYSTTYHHINKIDDILVKGKWIAAPINSFPWHGRIGQTALPPKTINKSLAIHKYCN